MSVDTAKAHRAYLRKELNELKAKYEMLKLVTGDLLQEKGLYLTQHHKEGLQRVLRLLEADGCYDCAFPTASSLQHHHHPADRAASYRLMLGPDSLDGSEGTRRTVRSALLDLLRVVTS